MCHHPLTVSGPKPAFKWSKHRQGGDLISTASPPTGPSDRNALLIEFQQARLS